MKDLLQQMLAYKTWANERFFETCATLTEAQLAAPQSIKFGSLERTLQHVYDMDLIWRSHLTGTPHGLTSRTPDRALPLAELAAAQSDLDRWFQDYCHEAEETKLQREIAFDFVEGGSGRMTSAEMLLHVVNHGTYHRGHAAGMLYDFGIMPPGTDMPILYAGD